MDVSIVIINYNTFQLTCDCVCSIFKHTKEISFEIILVDNGSADKDPALFSEIFPGIKLIKSKENLGFAKGNNLGIKEATGKYILLLNSDTKLQSNAIKSTYDYLEAHPEAGAVSAKLIFPDGRHQSVCQRFPSIKYSLFELFRLNKLLPKKIAGKILLGSFFDHSKNVEPDWVWGAYFMFRKKLLDLLPNKKLNETYFLYNEDMQWCWDIKKLGYQIHYNPKDEVIHYMGGSSGEKEKLIQQNYEHFMRGNYSYLHRVAIRGLQKLLAATQ